VLKIPRIGNNTVEREEGVVGGMRNVFFHGRETVEWLGLASHEELFS
jgi:hypothetical protein